MAIAYADSILEQDTENYKPNQGMKIVFACKEDIDGNNIVLSLAELKRRNLDEFIGVLPGGWFDIEGLEILRKKVMKGYQDCAGASFCSEKVKHMYYLYQIRNIEDDDDYINKAEMRITQVYYKPDDSDIPHHGYLTVSEAWSDWVKISNLNTAYDESWCHMEINEWNPKTNWVR